MKWKSPGSAMFGPGETWRTIYAKDQVYPFVILGVSLNQAPLRAQDTNFYPIAPATKLEALSTNVGAIIIKGTTDLGAVSAKTAAVSVKSKEMTEPASGHKERELPLKSRARVRPKT
jgi:hypothetical protein